MEPYSVMVGDCRDSLRRLAADGIRAQMCVTSPPYFGLRDYGHAGQLGLEQTPEQYIAAMVEVFRAVRDVLADDGTLWLNIGDSYAGSWGARGRGESTNAARPDLEAKHGIKAPGRHGFADQGIKPKDLIGIPWMLAFALRADGWYLRQEIVWSKPNPMPESVTDRCTKSHESLFLLAKRPSYYFDHEAIKEPVAKSQRGRVRADPVGGKSHVERGQHSKGGVYATGRKSTDPRQESDVGSIYSGDTGRLGDRQTSAGISVLEQVGNDLAAPVEGRARSKRDSFKRDDSKRAEVIPGQTVGTHRPDRDESAYDMETRNKRDVWTIATRPYKGAHFATFPPDLVKPCILAGSRPGDLVCDPFGGSGTSAGVAVALGRRAVLCELNPEYAALTPGRVAWIREQMGKAPKPRRAPKQQASSIPQVALF